MAEIKSKSSAKKSGKKNKFSTAWLHDHINDPYVKLAQQKGYRARAAFKLTEILDETKLLAPGMTVVDLGATPGSWSQVVRERLGYAGGKLRGRVLALDVLPMEPVADVDFIEGDFREDEVLAKVQVWLAQHEKTGAVDLVLSDMAPNLSGVALADATRMAHLNELALEFALSHLKPGGALLVKSFHGSGFSQTIELYRKHFLVVKEIKPKASRSNSSETFILARKARKFAK
jgi:23S rRNA (uridine2552-2'-O)-methyltransferase